MISCDEYIQYSCIHRREINKGNLYSMVQVGKEHNKSTFDELNLRQKKIIKSNIKQNQEPLRAETGYHVLTA